MKTLLTYGRDFRKIFTPIVVLMSVALASNPSLVQATSITDLQQQQQQLQQQAAQAQQQAEQQKTLAQRAADSLAKVSGQIAVLNDNIRSTQQQIADLQDQIAQKNQDIAGKESELRKVKDQENALVRQLYILAQSDAGDMTIFSNSSVSDQSVKEEQITSLKKAATAAYDEMQKVLADVVNSRNQLQDAANDQLALQQQQQGQQSVLADAQATQAALRNNAEAAQQQLEAQAAAARAQAAQIASRIRVLTANTNWGNQIVSSDDGRWYYTQTGDYTTLGDSPYTINDVGCLITSIAMVATYYGRHITPDYIANNGTFTSQGYLVSLPSNLGIRLQPSQHINWGVVNEQISAGHPVIVSIYLPSVGAINGDGSSHYIVIKGVANGKYLMHDPIGNNRSYNLNQVRSMILVNQG